MEIEYKWTISGIDGTPDDNGLKNIARAIHWRAVGFDINYPAISASRSGFVILDKPITSDFIPYEEVTEEIALNWLFSKLNKSEIESEIAEGLTYAPELAAIKEKSPLGINWSSDTPINPITI